MKIEGDLQEIKGLFQHKPGDQSRSPKKEPIFWIIMIVAVFLVLDACLWIDIFNPTWRKISIMGSYFLYIVVLIMVHHSFKSQTLTIITAAGGMILIAIALNVYTPQEIIKKIETKTTNKYSK